MSRSLPPSQGTGYHAVAIVVKWGADNDTDLVEVTKVGEELAGEVSSLALDLAAVTHGAVRAGLEDLLHTPVLANAVVDAGEAILGAKVEESGELVFNLGPGKLLDHTVVHDEELLLFTVGGSSRAGDTCKRLGDHRSVC